MGSLASRPTVPTQPQVVVVSESTSGNAQSETSASGIDTSDTDTASEARQQSLLGRDRSRFGTIQTGFRGLLGLAETNSRDQRKTLLGQ